MKNHISERELYDLYDAFLDETSDDINICGYTYLPSRALKMVDEVAYNCGFNDWLDSMCANEELVELDGEYYTEEEYENEI